MDNVVIILSTRDTRVIVNWINDRKSSGKIGPYAGASGYYFISDGIMYKQVIKTVPKKWLSG